MYRKIMVPLDGSPLAECVLPHVQSLIKSDQSAEILLVQAVEPIAIPYGREMSKLASIEQLKAFEAHNIAEAEKYLTEVAAKLAKTGANVKTRVLYGKAAEALADFAAKNGVDLVAMTTHGHSGVSHLVWGSVAERLIRSITIPTLVVRPPGCTPGD